MLNYLSKKICCRLVSPQLNYHAAKFLQALPISSEVIGPPKDFYESTLDWFVQYHVHNNRGATYHELNLDDQACRLEPKYLDQNIHWKFKRTYRDQDNFGSNTSSTFVCLIPNGRVWSDNAIIAPNDRLLSDLSTPIEKSINGHAIFKKWKLRPAHFMDGKVAVLSTLGGDNYFHWLFDVLPRLEMMRRGCFSIDSISHFVVNSCHLSFQKETLNYLDIPLNNVVETRCHTHIKAEELIVSSLPRQSRLGNSPRKFICDFLRQRFLTKKSSCSFGDRIYISRTTASYRRVVNEAEVINLLQILGFQVLDLEAMSFAEQISAFASAKVIVSPHGAGLSNLVFSSLGTKVIELFSPNYVHVCFWAICSHLNLDYYYLIGEGDRPPDYVHKPITYPYRDNIEINLEALSEILQCAKVD